MDCLLLKEEKNALVVDSKKARDVYYLTWDPKKKRENKQYNHLKANFTIINSTVDST